ncbi:dolichyl-phosphate beta-glucosyltransferase [Galdieria sulphuraria]|uniref:dolichyl-phosphate beta-glucosyltransferase n=1 Tax=Galdieria sulphuraria TaxID=130081 RepID=M2Y9Q5_GALSU|nr:dolichyl-phosphate beta-glucosyltransferase [Galdieria sulphuraria]EME32609.1 dolichyl-phosphate beta-glucosyltransferase [Galdieria sulphuraria]|eukprot:XP_005709129.1 dolichyl-phosphate beta-glucosyltransferase [Galdieria sulphuraria]
MLWWFALAVFSFLIIVYLYLKDSRRPSFVASAAHAYTFIDPADPSKTYPFPSLFSPAEKSLSVIVPAYNEEKRLPKMLEETIKSLEARTRRVASFSWEIIVVDDGSRDDTVEVAYKIGGPLGTDRFRVLRLPQNSGKGAAVKNGMLSSRGELLLMADADGATYFEDYLKLEGKVGSAYKEKPLIIIGSRAQLEQAERSFVRKLFMWGFHWYVNLIGGVTHIRDTQCGFKLFTREAARLVFPNQHLFRWAFDVELLYVAQQYSIPIYEVPVKWSEIPGSKLNILKAVLNMSRDLLIMRCKYCIGVWCLYNYRATDKTVMNR